MNAQLPVTTATFEFKYNPCLSLLLGWDKGVWSISSVWVGTIGIWVSTVSIWVEAVVESAIVSSVERSSVVVSLDVVVSCSECSLGSSHISTVVQVGTGNWSWSSVLSGFGGSKSHLEGRLGSLYISSVLKSHG